MVRISALLVMVAIVSSCDSDSASNGSVSIADTEIAALLELVNTEREKAGAMPLTYNEKLAQAAQAHTEDMVGNNFFSHTGSDGSSVNDRVSQTGYRWSLVGENVAVGSTSAATILSLWMTSEGHRANILNNGFTEIGIGRVESTWTQVFASPAPS